MSVNSFLLFALASLVLNITPGNDMIYVASRSAGQGIKAGIVSAFGIMAGCMVHIVAAVAGLSAIISKSATAFDIIKYLGAAYLIYLGIKSLLNKKSSFQLAEKIESISYKKIFWQGVITNVLNPKVALFFLAFLPPFIDINAPHPQWQILFLGIWFDCSGTLVNIIVAILFGRMGNWLARSPRYVRMQEKITGLLLIALGIKVALTSKK
ncbi:MAG: LysE family translocator [Bacteroidetes bacterium]|nr:LysE family translocator [Bacteroidota bacterium]